MKKKLTGFGARGFSHPVICKGDKWKDKRGCLVTVESYRQKGAHDADPIVFYTFPAAFEGEIAKGFNAKQFARVLAGAGVLKPPASGRGYQRKSPRIDGRQINVYVLQLRPDEIEGEE